MGKARAAALLAPLALAGGTLVLWATRLSTSAPVFSPLISGDLYWYFLPAYAYQARRLAEWRLPLWNPDQAVGTPFLATLQPGVLYPARALLAVVDPARAMALSLAAHLVFMTLGTYALGRTLGATRLASALAAATLTATLGANQFYWPSYFEAGAWWPVIALALVRVVGGGGWRWTLLLGVAGAMPVLAGGYQMTVYMAYALALLALGLVLDARFRTVGWGALVLRLGVAGVVAAATAAPQLLPTLAWSAETARRAAPLTDLQLDPYAWMRPPYAMVRQTLVGGPGFQPFFLSIPVIALALLGFARQRVLGAVMGVGTLALYAIAVGPASPFFTLYRLLPPLAMYRFPYRLLTSVFFLVAVGVALGLTVVARWRPARRPLAGRVLATAIFVVACAVLFARLHNRSSVPWLHAKQVLASSPLVQLAASRAGAGRVHFAGSWDFIQPRDAMLVGMQCTQDYEPLATRRLQEFLHAVADEPVPPGDSPTPFLGTVPNPNPLARPALLDLVATSVVVTTGSTTPMRVDGMRRAGKLGTSAVYDNPGALPRAYTVVRARFVGDEDAALAAIQSPDFDRRGEAVLVGAPTTPGEQALATAAARPAAVARIVRDEVETLDVEVRTTEPTLLVLADAFAPGWRVFVDGGERPLWQANYLVRAVVLAPGDRLVRFVYQAPGWRLGWIVFAAGWLVALTVVGLARQMK